MKTEDKELLKEILREIIIEQATREMSGIQWATDMLGKLDELIKGLAQPIETKPKN